VSEPEDTSEATAAGRIRVLLTGAGGQVGSAVTRRSPADATVVAMDSATLDITDEPAVRAAVGAARPDLILNAAGYTAVDQAEVEPERAFLVNRDGPANLAAAARANGARIIHLSTDFVFDGARGEPYPPEAPCRPINVYGASKRAGEEAVQALAGDAALVVRTSWVYAARGNNFVLTMLRLLREQPEVRVVTDQVGSPTWAVSLADALWRAARRADLSGIHHWADAGVASWYDLAVATQEESVALGLLSRSVPIHAISSRDLPRPAKRPPFAVLDTSLTTHALGARPAHWRVNLRLMLKELHAA
jgi:dTDP-4-dehydrorhamnose reductase